MLALLTDPGLGSLLVLAAAAVTYKLAHRERTPRG
jgi:hypothetical protein